MLTEPDAPPSEEEAEGAELEEPVFFEPTPGPGDSDGGDVYAPGE